MHEHTAIINNLKFDYIWKASLFAFVIAARGGLLSRIGMIDSFSAGFEPSHIGHAHSHLILMGWVTPAVMTLIAATWHSISIDGIHTIKPAGSKTRLTI